MKRGTRQSDRDDDPGYNEDLACIHDVAFNTFSHQCAPALLKVLELNGISSGHVVDIGCGCGVWARALVDAGFQVTGSDLSRTVIDIARKRVPEATFHVESLVTFPIPDCDVVTVLGEVLNYTIDHRSGLVAIRRLARRAFKSPRSGGFLILDVAEPGRHRERTQKFWEGDDWTCLAEFELDRSQRHLTRRIVTFRQVGQHWRRREELRQLKLYESQQIGRILRDAGFRVRVARRFDSYELPDRLVGFIARKP